MDRLACRHFALDAVKKANELLMARALHVLLDDRTLTAPAAMSRKLALGEVPQGKVRKSRRLVHR